MIPGSPCGATIPEGRGNILFHVVVDDSNQVFCMEHQDDTNAVRLHMEMMRHARYKRVNFRDFDLWAQSKDEAIRQIKAHYPAYEYLGGCLSVWAKAN